MSGCPQFPAGKIAEIIERTAQTGNEHGFVRCADGHTSKIVKGGKTSMSIESAVQECDLSNGPVDVIHTHPNGVADLSDQDRKAGADPNIRSVCAVGGDDVYCEMTQSCGFKA